MYFLNKFCCICMNKSDLKHLFDVDNVGMSHYNKLISSIAEMHFKELNNQRLICGECCVTLNTVYTFRQTCLRSKTNLITYISQLQTFSKVSGTLNVCLIDINHKIKLVKKEIKCENEENDSRFEESNPLRDFKTESYEESIQFPASVKKECESEDYSVQEDATTDHVNESVHSDVKVEVEHLTMMKDEPGTGFTEIDIKDPLAVVKEEPMSDSETPQDGSISQADAGTSEEPKKREETTIGTEHTQNIESVVGGLHKCEICKKSFNKKAHLNFHMQIHSGVKPFECEICKKPFIRKSDLNRHFQIHSTVRPYQCEVCKKSFLQKCILKMHMKIHSSVKPYECVICKKGFNQKGTLNTHMKVHSGERPHECEICKKSFAHKSYLSTHLRMHSGERPYECGICKKNFIYRSNLTEHLRIHSGEKPYECEVCRKSFTFKCNLTEHLKTHSKAIR